VCPGCRIGEPEQAPLVLQQIGPLAAGIAVETKPPSSLQTINSGIALAAEDKAEARLALFLAELRLTNTIDAKMPMMAMTIKSSIRVKPFFVFFIYSPTFLVFCFNFKFKTLSACQYT